MNVWEVAPRDDAEEGVGDDGAEEFDDDPADESTDELADGLADEPTDHLTTAAEPAPVEDEITPLAIDPPGETGDAVVDQAVRRLTQVDVLATEQHGEVYEDVHRELREVLSGLDR